MERNTDYILTIVQKNSNYKIITIITMSYTKTGICIWCGEKESDTTFNNAPHIIPQCLGGKEIGYDVCDECNSYFGTAQNGEPNTNLVFKEIFSAIRAFSKTPTRNTYKNLSSVYFNFFYSRNQIKIKGAFSIPKITHQFKRSLYEVFLQMYHFHTSKGLDAEMNAVRDFARYNKGKLDVYYLFNNVILAPQDDELFLSMSEPLLKEIADYGYFHFWFLGHSFLLEIIPTRALLSKDIYMQNMADKYIVPARGDEHIAELTDIRQIDFFMNRFGNKNIEYNPKSQITKQQY